MSQAANRNLIVLPNVRVAERIDLGQFFLCSSSDVTQVPKCYHEHVASFANMYRTHSHDISEVGLLLRARRTSRLHELSADERRQVDAVIDALAFAAIVRERLFSLAYDNFSYTVWSFRGDIPPSDHVSLSNRRYRFNVVDNKPHLIQLPLHVHYADLGQNQIDEHVLSALIRCAYSDHPDDQRLMRAIHWYLRAHTDSGDVTDYTRFAMTAIAFEALLNTPDRGVTAYFVRTVQLLLGGSQRVAAWAKAFYETRSKVIHGSDMPELMYGEHRHNSILALADIIFIQCVYRTFSLRNLWSDHIADQVRRKSVDRYLVSNKERFEYVIRYNLRNQNSEVARTVSNHLHTIQKSDASVDLPLTRSMIEAVVDLGIQGLSALSRNSEIRGTTRMNIVRFYRQGLRDIRDAAGDGKQLQVFQSLRGVPTDAADQWGDAVVRGIRFGAARSLSLDDIVAALHNLDEIHTNLIYDL